MFYSLIFVKHLSNVMVKNLLLQICIFMAIYLIVCFVCFWSNLLIFGYLDVEKENGILGSYLTDTCSDVSPHTG